MIAKKKKKKRKNPYRNLSQLVYVKKQCKSANMAVVPPKESLEPRGAEEKSYVNGAKVSKGEKKTSQQNNLPSSG